MWVRTVLTNKSCKEYFILEFICLFCQCSLRNHRDYLQSINCNFKYSCYIFKWITYVLSFHRRYLFPLPKSRFIWCPNKTIPHISVVLLCTSIRWFFVIKKFKMFAFRWKFSLVISGLTKTLTKINEMRPTIPELERDYFESLHIVLDTLEKCLSAKAQVRINVCF